MCPAHAAPMRHPIVGYRLAHILATRRGEGVAHRTLMPRVRQRQRHQTRPQAGGNAARSSAAFSSANVSLIQAPQPDSTPARYLSFWAVRLGG